MKHLKTASGWVLGLMTIWFLVVKLFDWHEKPITEWFSKYVEDRLFPKKHKADLKLMPGIYAKSRFEAEAALMEMEAIVHRNGYAAVADLYECLGLVENYSDTKKGWKNLDGAKIEWVTPNKYGFLMPEVINLGTAKERESLRPTKSASDYGKVIKHGVPTITWQHNPEANPAMSYDKIKTISYDLPKAMEANKRKYGDVRAWALPNQNLLNIQFSSQKEAIELMADLHTRVLKNGAVSIDYLYTVLGLQIGPYSDQLGIGWKSLAKAYVGPSQQEDKYILHLPLPESLNHPQPTPIKIYEFDPTNYVFVGHSTAVDTIQRLRKQADIDGFISVAWFLDQFGEFGENASSLDHEYGWFEEDLDYYIPIRMVSGKADTWYIKLPKPKKLG